MSNETRRLLDEFSYYGVLQPLDLQFALALTAMAGETAEPLVALGAALACRAPRLGHIYADLKDRSAIRVEPPSALRPALSSSSWPPASDATELPWPDGDEWVHAMSRSALVDMGSHCPLVLEGSRLYLHRYWEYQRQLGDALMTRAAVTRTINLDACRKALWRLFPKVQQVPEPNLQRLAAAIAVLGGIAVITGGPGTGKTTTVTRLLALLVEQARSEGRTLRIALAAPTGKAAARMAESIREGRETLDASSEVIAHIRADAFTIHRLLGFQRARPTQFRHHAANPLPQDVLVVDEASMIPLALMAKLVDALPSRATLVLLGDSDQLASVEAGAVLGDLCPPEGSRQSGYSRSLASSLDALGVELPEGIGIKDRPRAMNDSVVHLEHNFRFDATGGIGRLAREVNAGRGTAALNLLVAETAANKTRELELVEGPSPQEMLQHLRKLVLEGCRPVTETTSESDVLAGIGRFCILCAHRRGRLGSLQLNVEIQQWLADAGLLKIDSDWYPGRPVMVTQNDYRAGLFNGDIGVVLAPREVGGQRRVVFPSAEPPGWRSISPGRLPPHETVFAMTIHKSQGSEFDEVVVVLPTYPSPILTRELLYTGITRARKRAIVVGPRRVIAHGIEQRVQRASGLREMLWK